ncbi:MAG: hypothetical protein EB059_08780 [Alphaproteobacteria bacterium]|nr:hypothetical protein [Alphaproteobacteria bacterium]
MRKKHLLHYEHHSESLISHTQWLRRIFNTAWLALIIVGIALIGGIIGYHLIAGLGWVDAILEASMILGGMGAVAPMTSDAAKLFASAYALLSGLVIITITGIILAPFLHRMMHQFHEPKG